MTFLLTLWKYKYQTAIAVFFVLWLGQIAYTNHLSSKISKSEVACTAKVDSEVTKAIKPYIEAKSKQETELNQVSANYEKLKSEQSIKTESVTREVQKIIDRPVYSNVCIDTDGVQQINSLIKSSNSS